MEVDEVHVAAASHHPVGGHRRIDSAGQQAGHAPAGAGRQSARALFLAEEVEGLPRQELEVNGQLRVGEVDPPPLRFLDEAADFALELRRRERHPLVGPPRADAERRDLTVAQVRENRVGERTEVVRTVPGVREVRDAEDAPDARPGLVVAGRGAEVDLDAAHDGAHAGDVDPLQRDAEVAHQQLHEPGSIAPLEREFLVVNDYRLHVGRAASAARWPLRTALSIVAGKPVSIQSPAR